jgi:hypothetical protein
VTFYGWCVIALSALSGLAVVAVARYLSGGGPR